MENAVQLVADLNLATPLNVAGGELFKDTVEFCRVTRPKKTSVVATRYVADAL